METKFTLHDRESILKFLQDTINGSVELQQHVKKYEKGTVVFTQGQRLNYLSLILKGRANLRHVRYDGSSLDLLKFEPGHFMGLLAFTTGNPSLTTCTVVEDIYALRIEQSEFEQYVNDHPDLRSPLQILMMINMSDRFLQNLRLESQMHSLNQRLKAESEELRMAYRQLESSHQKLIHQEKMATLGELVAGFAHEINNPAAALIRSAEALKENFQELPETESMALMFKSGLDAEPISSSEIRERMLEIQKRFPYVEDRSATRKLAQMPELALEVIDSNRKKISITQLIQQFEAGKLIHNIQLASARIAGLVKSLKSYSRQDKNQAEMIDIRTGIKDTILVLTNRLKFLDVNIELNEIPETCARMGELNQVWTNILVNACEILPDGGQISIKTWSDENSIFVEIADNGPGIPPEVLSRIFEPNYTTKNQGSQFGLGLGLAISNQIIRKLGGNIEASNNKVAGAKFLTSIPIVKC
ncbi:MAG: ATP-binding protein [Balneolaceae bacterium]